MLNGVLVESLGNSGICSVKLTEMDCLILLPHYIQLPTLVWKVIVQSPVGISWRAQRKVMILNDALALDKLVYNQTISHCAQRKLSYPLFCPTIVGFLSHTWLLSNRLVLISSVKAHLTKWYCKREMKKHVVQRAEPRSSSTGMKNDSPCFDRIS